MVYFDFYEELREKLEAAIKRADERRNEDIETWAERLAQDLAKHKD